MDNSNNKIRVCFVSPKAYPIFNSEIESVFGGAEVDLYMIGTELAKDTNFEVSFIVADYGQPQVETRENIQILKSLNFKQNPLTGALKIWKALKQSNADMYMLKTASLGVPLTQRFCRKYHRHLIYKTANSGECDGSYHRKHPIRGRLFIHSLKRCFQIITQNQQDKESLKYAFNMDSIVIPNGHRIPENVSVEKDIVLWVGRSAAVKAPHRFLELAKMFPDERFVMICQRATGDGQYEILKKAATNVANLEFIERVHFNEIDNYFNRAKILVNTSDSEGFPNTFIQACKTGAAILSYTVNPDGFLDEHQCGISCKGDDTVMTEQLRNMLDASRYRKFGNNGIGYVKAQHDIGKIIESYKMILKLKETDHGGGPSGL